jgi:hypothetical protein
MVLEPTGLVREFRANVELDDVLDLKRDGHTCEGLVRVVGLSRGQQGFIHGSVICKCHIFRSFSMHLRDGFSWSVLSE